MIAKPEFTRKRQTAFVTSVFTRLERMFICPNSDVLGGCRVTSVLDFFVWYLVKLTLQNNLAFQGMLQSNP